MENYMWHVALEPGTTKLQDVIIAKIAIAEYDTLCLLLGSRHLVGKQYGDEKGGYVLLHAAEYERPYPSIMIWRFRKVGEEKFIEDMRQEDAWVLEHIWRNWLMPEETDAEYVPPKQFLVMERG